MIIFQFVSVVIIGYLIGSIPCGVLVGKLYGKVDIRKFGSGKIGTTNVLRTVGKKAAALVLFLDLLKGSLAVVFAGLIVGRNYLVINDFGLGLLVAQCLAALAAMAGHNWSVFLKFKGGKRCCHFLRRTSCPLSGGSLIWGRGFHHRGWSDQICFAGFYRRGSRHLQHIDSTHYF